LACCTASIDSVRIVLMQSWSRSCGDGARVGGILPTYRSFLCLRKKSPPGPRSPAGVPCEDERWRTPSGCPSPRFIVAHMFLSVYEVYPVDSLRDIERLELELLFCVWRQFFFMVNLQPALTGAQLGVSLTSPGSSSSALSSQSFMQALSDAISGTLEKFGIDPASVSLNLAPQASQKVSQPARFLTAALDLTL
jgi:hypothetical protein